MKPLEVSRPQGARLWACMLLAAFFCLYPAERAFAHEGLPPAPHDLWTAWNWEPLILLGLSGWVYGRGLQALRGRPPASSQGRGGSFFAGLVVLFFALVSPLDALASALFSAHMGQHMLLMLIAPPLLIAGLPLGPFLLGVSPAVRVRAGRFWRGATAIRAGWETLSRLPVAWALHALLFWGWHLPTFYQAALGNEGVHMLEHLSFLGTALLFWWVILHPRGRAGEGAGVLALFTMALQGGLLGALITFASIPWYPMYAQTTQLWGLTPLEDQQLAGAIMWLPGGVIYTLAALRLLAKHLTLIEHVEPQGKAIEPETDRL